LPILLLPKNEREKNFVRPGLLRELYALRLVNAPSFAFPRLRSSCSNEGKGVGLFVLFVGENKCGGQHAHAVGLEAEAGFVSFKLCEFFDVSFLFVLVQWFPTWD
jgi:hypothetical protein